MSVYFSIWLEGSQATSAECFTGPGRAADNNLRHYSRVEEKQLLRLTCRNLKCGILNCFIHISPTAQTDLVANFVELGHVETCSVLLWRVAKATADCQIRPNSASLSERAQNEPIWGKTRLSNVLHVIYLSTQQQNSATKVRKLWNEAKVYKKVGLLTTFLCSLDMYDVSSQHIFKAIALPDKIQQSKFGSFHVHRL